MSEVSAAEEWVEDTLVELGAVKSYERFRHEGIDCVVESAWSGTTPTKTYVRADDRSPVQIQPEAMVMRLKKAGEIAPKTKHGFGFFRSRG
ncbi:MAG TPA: hypothetical protein VLE47_02340 [Candidatus Saccharimonadales bacterium]|nr:hypothetical protein [Candidatus Saccharimonadales bacterium]